MRSGREVIEAGPAVLEPAGAAPARRPSEPLWKRAAQGFILGLLVWVGAQQLNLQALPIFRMEHSFPIMAALGVLIGLSRARSLLWVCGGLVCVGMLVVAYTPLVKPLAQGLVRSDPPERVEAAIILASSIQDDGELTTHAQSRLLKGYELLKAGYARRLVISRLPMYKHSYLPVVRRQMAALGMDYPIEEVGPAFDTHDEAVRLGRLAAERGWKRVLLVTEPTHTRRAGAVFEKAGSSVICVPSDEQDYDLQTLTGPKDRLNAFRDWFYEAVGFQAYRLRGWI